MEFPHLSKAPLVEAVIDIQTINKEGLSTDQLNERLRSAHEKLKQQFPEIKARASKQIQFSDKAPEPSIKDLIEGYFFKSKDGLNVAQFRPNGFAISRMQKYQTFDELLAEAKKFWAVYLSVGGKFSISRLAVRYINQIRVPFPLQDNADYLTEIRKPKTSPTETRVIKGFADQIVSLDAESGATVGMVRIMQEPPANATEAMVIVDIDTYRVVSDIAPDDPQIWEIISSFREVKNRVFFGSVGKRTVEAYK